MKMCQAPPNRSQGQLHIPQTWHWIKSGYGTPTNYILISWGLSPPSIDSKYGRTIVGYKMRSNFTWKSIKGPDRVRTQYRKSVELKWKNKWCVWLMLWRVPLFWALKFQQLNCCSGWVSFQCSLRFLATRIFLWMVPIFSILWLSW